MKKRKKEKKGKLFFPFFSASADLFTTKLSGEERDERKEKERRKREERKKERKK